MASLFAKRFMNCSHSPHATVRSHDQRRVLFLKLFAYIHVFCLFVFSKDSLVLRLVLVMELTCVTLTSKNAVCPCCQKPLVLLSKRPYSLVFAVRKLKISLSSRIRLGSDCTFVHTLFNSVINKSFILS